MQRRVLATFVVLSVFGLILFRPSPADAQPVPPNRNAFSVSIVNFNPSVFAVGLAYPIAPDWDLTFSYAFQPGATATGSLIAAGGRYHLKVATPGMSAHLGAGVGISGTALTGFRAANSSGVFLSGGATLAFNQQFGAYGSATVFALGGGTSTVFDLGIQARLSPRIAGQLGYVSFGGRAAPYLGVTVALR
ncbi:MAG: hypothetical protein ACRDF6_00540 [bacterium]